MNLAASTLLLALSALSGTVYILLPGLLVLNRLKLVDGKNSLTEILASSVACGTLIAVHITLGLTFSGLFTQAAVLAYGILILLALAVERPRLSWVKMPRVKSTGLSLVLILYLLPVFTYQMISPVVEKDVRELTPVQHLIETGRYTEVSNLGQAMYITVLALVNAPADWIPAYNFASGFNPWIALITLVGVYLLVKEVFNRDVALAATALYYVFPVYSRVIDMRQSIMAVPFLAFSLYYFTRYMKTGDRKLLAHSAIHLAVCFGGLTTFIAGVLTYIALAFLLMLSGREWESVSETFFLTNALLLFIAPFAIETQFHTTWVKGFMLALASAIALLAVRKTGFRLSARAAKKHAAAILLVLSVLSLALFHLQDERLSGWPLDGSASFIGYNLGAYHVFSLLALAGVIVFFMDGFKVDAGVAMVTAYLTLQVMFLAYAVAGVEVIPVQHLWDVAKDALLYFAPLIYCMYAANGLNAILEAVNRRRALFAAALVLVLVPHQPWTYAWALEHPFQIPSREYVHGKTPYPGGIPPGTYSLPEKYAYMSLRYRNTFSPDGSSFPVTIYGQQEAEVLNALMEEDRGLKNLFYAEAYSSRLPEGKGFLRDAYGVENDFTLFSAIEKYTGILPSNISFAGLEKTYDGTPEERTAVVDENSIGWVVHGPLEERVFPGSRRKLESDDSLNAVVETEDYVVYRTQVLYGVSQ